MRAVHSLLTQHKQAGEGINDSDITNIAKVKKEITRMLSDLALTKASSYLY